MEDGIAKYKETKVAEKPSAEWMRNEVVDVIFSRLLSGDKIDAIAANNDAFASKDVKSSPAKPAFQGSVVSFLSIFHFVMKKV